MPESRKNSLYETSPNGRYVLSRDGAEVMRGTEWDVVDYIHRNHCYSVDHAIRHEGYSVAPEQ